MNRLNNERGFMLLNVVILTLITSFAAMILMNAAPRLTNPQSVLRLTAIHLANEQLAVLESLAAKGELETGDCPFKGESGDLTTTNAGKPITFKVTTDVDAEENLRRVKVTVTIEGDEDFELTAERTIVFVPNQTE